jgi:hypothetical protein
VPLVERAAALSGYVTSKRTVLAMLVCEVGWEDPSALLYLVLWVPV